MQASKGANQVQLNWSKQKGQGKLLVAVLIPGHWHDKHISV